MSTTVNSDRDGESEPQNPLSRAVLAIRRSFLLFVAVVGVVLMAIGASPLVTGIFAGMFGIWGATALCFALLGFAVMKSLQLLDN
jgi:membrane-bound ClpP family serine protease